jgi:DNA-binding GntR family transcriptional regulator
LNVSRVPVREALRLLEAQGIVRSDPYKGMRFMEVDERLVRDVREVRLQLEILAARLCLARLGDIGVLASEMALHLDRMMQAQARGRLLEVAEADIDFHGAIYRHSGNAVLLRFWGSMAKQLSIIFSTIMRDTRYATLYEDHRRLIDAFAAADAGAVERELRAHVLTAADKLFTGAPGQALTMTRS